MTRALPLLLFAGMLCGCSPGAAPNRTDNRIETVEQSDSVSIYRDKKTGCEFIHTTQSRSEAIAYIPGTCDKDKP